MIYCKMKVLKLKKYFKMVNVKFFTIFYKNALKRLGDTSGQTPCHRQVIHSRVSSTPMDEQVESVTFCDSLHDSDVTCPVL